MKSNGCTVEEKPGKSTLPMRSFERKPGMRAEALDCVIYGLAARQLLTLNLDRREAELSTTKMFAPQIPSVIKSK
jgi:phage terminase large subunit GpA-like protein